MESSELVISLEQVLQAQKEGSVPQLSSFRLKLRLPRVDKHIEKENVARDESAGSPSNAPLKGDSWK